MAGALGVDNAHQGANAAHQATGVIAHRSSALGGAAALLAGDTHDAGLGLDGGVKGGVIRIGAALPIARNRGIDNAGIDLLQYFIGDAELLHGAGLKIFNHRIRLGHQLQEQLLVRGVFHVEDDALFAPVPGGIVATGTVLDDLSVPGVVAQRGIFNLDNLCTVIAEQQCAHRAGHELSEVKNADTFQRFHLLVLLINIIL